MMEGTDKNKSDGYSLIDAINAKYSDEEHSGNFKIYISSKAPGKKDGAGIMVPPILALDDNKVTCAGATEMISSMCSHINELDLTKNAITCWKEVLKMIGPLQSLHTLNLTSNPLCNDSLTEDVEGQTFPNCKLLILNNTQTSWQALRRLLRIFPCLTELHLSLNRYQDIEMSNTSPYPSLTKLHINKHGISSWSEMSKLGYVFPSLETLVTIESELSDLTTDKNMSSLFPCLKCLHISKTKLADWENIEKLRNFPQLYDIRMKNIPFLENYQDKERRQRIIAHLPNVTHLNGSKIQENEREDSERAFIRLYMDENYKPKRYFELEEKYGKLDPLAVVDLAPKFVFKVKVKCEHTSTEQEMDVDVRQTVREFKKSLHNFVGLPPSKFRLFYIEILDTGPRGPTELQFPDKHLHSLMVKDGDEFLAVAKYNN